MFNQWLSSVNEESDEEQMGKDSCVICKGHERLLLCYGDRAPGAQGGCAERAHHLCKECLDKSRLEGRWNRDAMFVQLLTASTEFEEFVALMRDFADE